MWLEVGPSNNNPGIIAQYYIDCMQQMGGTARIIVGLKMYMLLDCNASLTIMMKVFYMTNLVQISELRRFGECYERAALITLKIYGTVVCFVTVMTNRLSALSFVLWVSYNGNFQCFHNSGIYTR